MEKPEDIAAKLPEPRDDEPDHLRQEIVEELSDHLQCALRRERHVTSDEAEARRRVLRRFGDPARIARQLWFDAMKERIMRERIMLGVACVMAAACLAAVGLVWMTVQESREVNAALLEKLAAIAAREQKPPASPEWNPVKVKLVEGSEDGPPAEGFQISLHGPLGGTEQSMAAFQINEKSNAKGLVDLGLLKAGRYQFTLSTPWHERHTEILNVRPGTSPVKTIVCPQGPPEDVDVTVSIADLPAELKGDRFWILCDFQRTGRTIAEQQWSSTGLESPVAAAIVTDRGMIEVTKPVERYDVGEKLHFPSIAFEQTKLPESRQKLNWPEGDYRLSMIDVFLSPVELPLKEIGVEDPQEMTGVPIPVLGRHRYPSPPFGGGMGGIGGSGGGFMGGGGGFFSLPGGAFSGPGPLFSMQFGDGVAGSTSSPPPHFVARPGQKNHWKVTLPQKLISEVRKRLPRENAELDLNLNWPQDLQHADLKTLLIFEYRPSGFGGQPENERRNGKRIFFQVEAAPDGRLVNQGRLGSGHSGLPAETVQWPAGWYRLVEITTSQPAGDDSWHVVAQHFYLRNGGDIAVGSDRSSSLENAPRYHVKVRGTNQWNINPPNELLQAIRKNIGNRLPARADHPPDNPAPGF